MALPLQYSSIGSRQAARRARREWGAALALALGLLSLGSASDRLLIASEVPGAPPAPPPTVAPAVTAERPAAEASASADKESGAVSAVAVAGSEEPGKEKAEAAPTEPAPTEAAPTEAAPTEPVPTDAEKAEAGKAEGTTSAARSTKPRELSAPLLSGESQFRVDRSRRPAWVEQAPSLQGDVHYLSVSSTPHATQRSALEALDVELVATVGAYIREQLESAEAAERIQYSAKEIRARLVKEPIYMERGELVDSGPMYDAHARLDLDASFRAELLERWRQAQAAARLARFAVVAGVVILLIGLVRVKLGLSRSAVRKAETTSEVVGSRGLKLSVGTAILAVGVAVTIVAVRAIRGF